MLDRANKELVEALEWYMDQQDGMDAKFIDQFEIDATAILKRPLIYPRIKRGYRQVLMETFPYFIVYLVNRKAGIISIVSIFHTSRHPKQKFRK